MSYNHQRRPVALPSELCVSRRQALLATGGALAGLAFAGCGGDDDEPSERPTRTYFGWVLGTPNITAVAFDVDPPDEGAERNLRAYVCDGLGPPDGKALWFSGPATSRSLTSAGGDETLTIDSFRDRVILGTFADSDRAAFQFAAYPATDGAGIYEVTVDEDLHVTGTSTDGSKLDARADPSGRTEATITTAGGEKLSFVVHNLSLATPVALERRALPAEDYRRFAGQNQIPGQYTAVIAPHGSHWLGRSGNVRTGREGDSIIGLDKKD